MGNVDVTTEVVIAASRERVAAFAADPDNATAWYANIVAATWETPPPIAVGSRIAFEARFLGRTMAYTYRVEEYEPGTRLVMRTAEGPFPMETTYEWEDTSDGGTRMRLRNRGAPSGFAKVASSLMASSMRKANRKDLDRLRAVVEG
jgi:uncharacterized protein YndB with AHSA1/START domain